MGDDSVICLSSDDEFEETSIKKQKTNNAPLIAKIEPKEDSKEKLNWLKRKTPDSSTKSGCNLTKKPKIERSHIEEITIESPVKDVSKECRLGASNKEHSSMDILQKEIKNGTITINKISLTKSSELSESANQSKSSQSTVETAPARNEVRKVQLSIVKSRESNGKKADDTKLRNLKSNSECTASKVINPVAKLNKAKSPTSTMLKTVRKFFDTRGEELATSETTVASLAVSEIEVPETPSLRIAADNRAANGTCSKSRHEASESLKNVETVDTVRADSAEIARPSERENTKSDDSPTIREPLKSTEVSILPIVETPKGSRSASDETEIKALFSSSDASKSERNIENLSPKSSKKSQFPSVASSEISNDDSEKDTSSKATDSIDAIVRTKATPPQSPTGDCDAKSEGSKNDEKTIRRITPQLLPQSSGTSDRSKPDAERKKISLKISSPRSSKESNGETGNGVEKVTSTDGTNSKAKERKSMDFESKPGSSKSPDESRSVVSSLKQKSSSKREKTEKRSSDSSKSKVEFEPQPGCSKSPDNVDDKPRLVVVDKKPVFNNSEDTFSMFLSLCMQTDRCADMEKVVAKLKRYYDELNPAYAASQAFRDTLNEKRELITQKGKQVVYHYVQLLKKDMKAKKRIQPRDGDAAANGREDPAPVAEEEQDGEEARRVRQKIKRIEKAMKECQKMIKKYEEAEINFDDENNSNYMKLDRFKERMVQLYTQMCKYTNEHPDAGRAYLRPKHLRVTQIDSINQAINSFINSKLAINKKKVAKGKSFVDGLIFPDYVDILECVEKVNEEENMGLNKRSMQNLAEEAFTKMGRHLQEARQNDYWDTFSLNLDNNVDPASSDTNLSEKLSSNKKIAEENVKKVFEEFVRRQEEGNDKDEDDLSEEEEDEDEEDEEDEAKNKKANRDDESDVEMSIDEDSDRESVREDDKKDNGKPLETVSEAPEDENEECTVEDIGKDTPSNDNLESTSDERVAPPTSEKEAVTIEVTLDDVDTEDDENEPVQEEKAHQLLRIRSFAKQPDSWQSSQEQKGEKDKGDGTKSSENTEDEISVVSFRPGRETVVQNSNGGAKSIVGFVSGRLSAVQPVNAAARANSNSVNGQNPKYITLGRPVQLPAQRVRNNVQAAKIVGVSRLPGTAVINTKQVKLGTPVGTSTPVQRPQLQIRPRMPLQQTNQVQLLRLSDGKCVTTSVARMPNAPRFVAVATTSTPRFQGPRIVQRTPISNQQIGGVLATSTPIQPRPNLQPNRAPVALTAAQFSVMQMQRLNNGKYVARAVSSSENSLVTRERQVERNTQQPKATNAVAAVKGGSVAGTTLPVLKPRMNDNVQAVQQQRSNASRIRPGDQNRRTSESGPKRKNDPS